MFRFTGKQETDAITNQMQETRERFVAFIAKLEEKLKEFAEASIPELTELNNTDEDEFKRSYFRMKSAVCGQLDSIHKKAVDTMEEKITHFPYPSNNHEISTAYYALRGDCYERFSQFDELYKKYLEKIGDTEFNDCETAYQEILSEFEATRNNFRCIQCGSPVTVDKIYFTTTYITCPACQTQNTFDPGTKAKQLEHLGRSIAEQRTKHLFKEYDKIADRLRELYTQTHELKLSILHESNKTIVAQKTAQIQELEKQYREMENNRPVLYQKYLRAMFDEWNKINPALSQQHEGFYNRLWDDYMEQNKSDRSA